MRGGFEKVIKEKEIFEKFNDCYSSACNGLWSLLNFKIDSIKSIGHITNEKTFMMCPTFLLNFVGAIHESPAGHS